MGYRIRCVTLFDITKTGMSHRTKPVDMDTEVWTTARNTQCNLDTIVQAISLRSLPEVYDTPVKNTVTLDQNSKFGYTYSTKKPLKVPTWSFDFHVQDTSVFYDGISALGYLDADCHQVPMITCPTMYSGIKSFLDTSDELRNIYFEVVQYEE